MNEPQEPEAAETVQTTEPEAVAPAAICSVSSFLEAVAKLDDQLEDIHHQLDKLLQKRGWKHTSRTPGCVWMLEKTMPDGRVVLTDRGTARMFEEEMCADDPEPNTKPMEG